LKLDRQIVLTTLAFPRLEQRRLSHIRSARQSDAVNWRQSQAFSGVASLDPVEVLLELVGAP
jgi:hypothetical protein